MSEPKDKVQSINGYPLFNDVEDKELQIRNRATILANIIEDNLYDDTGVVTQAGMMYSLGYWDCIPEEEREAIYKILKEEVLARNLIQGGL